MKRLAALILVIVCAAGVAWYVAPAKKPRGFSGLEFSVMTPSAAARAPLLTARGALVYSVMPDSPADLAGIKPGEVVGAIDDAPINSARDASDIMRGHRAGDRVTLTLFDETLGDIHPRHIAVTVTEAPPVTKSLSVRPPRTLAKEFFYPPPMAANAAWSLRLARGPTIRPRQIFGIGAGRCNGFAPEEWVVKGYAKDDSMIHLAAKQGFQHALYATALLKGQDPMAFVRSLLLQNFQGPVTLTPSGALAGFTMFDFGNRTGAAGFVDYRVKEGRIAVWIAAYPSADATWNKPLAGAMAFTLNCRSPLASAAFKTDTPLVKTAISTQCQQGHCEDSDAAAAAYLKVLQLGYVHNAKGEMFLVNPKRDFWQNGAEGPGFYRQIGGENEKLEPGRTN